MSSVGAEAVGSGAYVPVFAVSSVSQLQAQVTAAAVAGGIVAIAPGTYNLTAAISVPANLPGRVRIVGAGIDATKIVLSSGAPAFVQLAKTATGDTLGNVSVEDLTVDASALTINTIVTHGIIGTMGAGAAPTNVNLADIAVRRVKGIGGPVNTDGTHSFAWVAIMNAVDTAGTLRTIDRILIEDVDLAGGENGIQVGAFRISSGASDMANVNIDDITIRRWKHVIGATPSAFFVSNNVIVGLRGRGKRVRISDGYGQGCGDAGLEIDTLDDVVIERCVIEDAYNSHFFHVQYNNPLNPTAQTIRWRDCTAKRTNYTPASPSATLANGQGYGWYVSNNSTFPMRPANLMMWEGCVWAKTTADLAVAGSAVWLEAAQHVYFDNCLFDESGISYVGGNATDVCQIMVRPEPGNTTYFRARRCRFQVAGTRTATGTGPNIFAAIRLTYGNIAFTIDDCAIDYNIVNATATEMRGFYFGDDLRATTLGGTIRRCRLERSSDTSGKLITISHSGQNTIQPKILIDDCNHRPITTGNASTVTTDLIFYRTGSGSQQNFANVFVTRSTPSNSKYPGTPAAITPGASPYSYRNQDGFSEQVIVQGGTVTKIEWSQDNTNWYDLGVIAGQALLEAGDYLKITYSVAPTMTKVFTKA